MESLAARLDELHSKITEAESKGKLLKQAFLLSEAVAKCRHYPEFAGKFHFYNIKYAEHLVNLNWVRKALDVIQFGMEKEPDEKSAIRYEILYNHLRSTNIGKEDLFKNDPIPPLETGEMPANLEEVKRAADENGFYGLALVHNEQYYEAEEFLRKATELAAQSGDSLYQVKWLRHMSLLLKARHMHSDAVSVLKKAIDLAIEYDYQVLKKLVVAFNDLTKSSYRYYDSAIFYSKLFESLPRDNEFKSYLLCQAVTHFSYLKKWPQIISLWKKHSGKLKRGLTDLRWYDNSSKIHDKALKEIENKKKKKPNPYFIRGFLMENAVVYDKVKDEEGFKRLANLICDINLAQLDSSDIMWQKYLGDVYLKSKILMTALSELARAGRNLECFELSQRIKSIGFCAPNIKAIIKEKSTDKNINEFKRRFNQLRKEVKQLTGEKGDMAAVMGTREAAERLIEHCAKIQGEDPVLAARLGGIPRVEHCLDGLPGSAPLAILDFNVTEEGTIIFLIHRDGGQVKLNLLLGAHIDTLGAADLIQSWYENRVNKEITEKQYQAIKRINMFLHDNLFCGLTETLQNLRISQIIMIPDFMLRHLPMHLAMVCKEHVKGIESEWVDHFAALFPVEYASSLNMLIYSQYKRRPLSLKKIVCFSDPLGDLPGALHNAFWLKKRFEKNKSFKCFTGAEATFRNFKDKSEDADLIILQTHGNSDAFRPLQSSISFSDGDLTMKDILGKLHFKNNPAVLLFACEIGSASPGNDADASGIPSALLSVGASAVLASAWQVEDVSAGYIAERFIHYFSHPGFRPAAALQLSIKDIRILKKDEAVERLDDILTFMQKENLAKENKEGFLMLDNLRSQIVSANDAKPFDQFNIWGGISIHGSGWNAPKQAGVIGDNKENYFKLLASIQYISENLKGGEFKEAYIRIKENLGSADGMMRANLLKHEADTVLKLQSQKYPKTSQWKAKRLLAISSWLAGAEGDKEFLEQLNRSKSKLKNSTL